MIFMKDRVEAGMTDHSPTVGMPIGVEGWGALNGFPSPWATRILTYNYDFMLL
jgi:hypothetical protein